MSALPNPLPSQSIPKKPAGRQSKLNKYGRDPNSPSEKMRRSDLDTLAPFAPFPISFMSDLARLTSGNSCTLLILGLWVKSAGRGIAKKGDKYPEWTEALAVVDLAQLCRCDERTIERELKALGERGLAEVKKEGKGKISARLRYREWESLPDYTSNVVELPAPVEPEAEDETAEQKEGFQRLTGKKGLTIKAGAQSKPLPVNVGVKSVQFQAAGSVDIEFVSVIQAGEQVVKASVPAVFLESLRKQYAVPNVSNDLDSGTRHGCRGEQPKPGGNHKSVVKHPRADEIAAIFDPLLKKSQARLLSTDESALAAACEAIGGMPRNDLIAMLMTGADPRAARPITSPKHVSKIITELRRNWERAGGVPDIQLPRRKDAGLPSRDEIEAIAQREREALQKAREAARRRK